MTVRTIGGEPALDIATGSALLAHVLDTTPDVVAVKDASLRYVIVNAACVAVMGRPLAAIIGRFDLDLYPPAIADELRRVDETVLATGESRTVTEWVPHAGRDGELRAWTSVKAPLRRADGTVVGVVVTARDETERRIAETTSGFMHALEQALRGVDDPVEAQFRAASLLGRHLGATRVGYAEDVGDGTTIDVVRDYVAPGAPSIIGRYRYDDFGPSLAPAFRAGTTVVRPDIARDPSLSEAERAAHAALALHATINVPLHEAGRLLGVFFVHQDAARAWRPDEIHLIEAVAARTRDAVAQSRAESARRTSDARFRALFERSPLPTAIYDVEGRAVAVNAAFDALWHLADDLGASTLDVRTDRAMQRAGITAAFERALAGEQTVLSAVPLALGQRTGAPAGVPIVTTHVFPLDDAMRRLAPASSLPPGASSPADAELLVVVQHEDMTARVRLLEAAQVARESAVLEERRLAAVLAAMPIGVIVADAPSGRIRYTNAALWDVWGQGPATRDLERYSDEWVGYRVAADGTTTTQRYASTEWPMARALRHGETVRDEAIEIARPDGVRVRVSVSAAPIRDADDTIVGGVVTVVDMTEPMRARATIEAAREAAERANRAKSEFLANMSHELRTPLNAIQGHIALIDVGIHGPVTEPQREALARVQKAQRHLLGLITDILDYAKVEAGRVEFAMETVGLHALLHDVRPMIEPLVHARGLAFTVRVVAEAEAGGGTRDAGGPHAAEHDHVHDDVHDDAHADDHPELHVLADRDKLVQILLNLLSNAIKFTPAERADGAAGAVRIEIHRRRARPDYVFVRVCDTGVGVPEDKYETIFEPFVQLSTGYTRTSEGTGLGLAISRDLARGMGGDLRVRSTVGSGTCFTLSLRVASAPGGGVG